MILVNSGRRSSEAVLLLDPISKTNVWKKFSYVGISCIHLARRF